MTDNSEGSEPIKLTDGEKINHLGLVYAAVPQWAVPHVIEIKNELSTLREQLKEERNKAIELYNTLDNICYKYGSNSWSYESRREVLDILRKFESLKSDSK